MATNVRVDTDTVERLRVLGDGRPLGVTIARLVELHGDQPLSAGATLTKAARRPVTSDNSSGETI